VSRVEPLLNVLTWSVPHTSKWENRMRGQAVLFGVLPGQANAKPAGVSEAFPASSRVKMN
jgi:hypothetical protein